MATIKELASKCGVSEQAVRGWCRRNHVAKDAKGSFAITESVEADILRHYGVSAKDVAKDVSQHSESIYAILKGELEQKDKQINELMKQLSDTTESLKVAQMLQVNYEKKLSLLEQKEKEDEQQKPEQAKKWWRIRR